jgi:hypothetical protein
MRMCIPCVCIQCMTYVIRSTIVPGNIALSTRYEDNCTDSVHVQVERVAESLSVLVLHFQDLLSQHKSAQYTVVGTCTTVPGVDSSCVRRELRDFVFGGRQLSPYRKLVYGTVKNTLG